MLRPYPGAERAGCPFERARCHLHRADFHISHKVRQKGNSYRDGENGDGAENDIFSTHRTSLYPSHVCGPGLSERQATHTNVM
jgi:hypothetical protein